MPPARDHVPSLCARYSHLSPVVTQENADTDHTGQGDRLSWLNIVLHIYSLNAAPNC
jgi:hypothetical protein